MKKITIIAAIVGLIGSAINSNAQLINTFPAWDGTTAVSPFGESGYATVGEVFTVDAGFTQLDAFAFSLASASPTGGPITFASFVAAWDPINLHATGPLLFGGGPYSIAASATDFSPLVVSTGGLNLTAGTQYVAFLTASLFFDGVGDQAKVAFVGSDVYSGGGAVAFDNGSDLTLLGTTTWIATPADFAFAASFSPAVSPVPEPSTYGVVAITLLGGLAVSRRKHSKVA